MKNPIVDSHIQSLYQEAKRQFENKEITDSEYTEILDLIGQVECAFAGIG